MRLHPRYTSLIGAILMACALAAGMAKPAAAETPGEHSHYLHALSDLRFARAMLWLPDESNVKAHERQAIGEIDQAIRECVNASIDDGAPLGFRPPVDANLSHADRLRRALRALLAANHDLYYEEDNPYALGWRWRAIHDTNDAIMFTRQAIAVDRVDDVRSDF